MKFLSFCDIIIKEVNMEIEYKTIDEQIEEIKKKNIIFKDEENAKDILLKENYYNVITAYKDIFINIKMSKNNGTETCDSETYFEEIYEVYNFDRELRNLMFKYISIIENNIKSCISNVFSEKYGTINYLKPENFNITSKNKYLFEELMAKIKSNVSRNINNYDDIKQCKKENNTIPLWMLTTLMTFGNMTNFYNLLKIEDKKEIAMLFQINYRDMNIFLKILNIIRNISAHGTVLFNIKIDIKYPLRGDSYYHEKLKIPIENNTYANGINDLLAVIIILKRFLQGKRYIKFTHELEEIINDVKEELDSKSFENFMEEMGIPLNYTELKEL